MYVEHSGAEPTYAVENLLGTLGPDEGLRILIVQLEVAADVALELPGALVDSALDGPLREQRKEPLDLIEPGALRRREVYVGMPRARQ